MTFLALAFKLVFAEKAKLHGLVKSRGMGGEVMMKLEPRISIVTLGVDDLDRARNFYDAMGLQRYEKINEGVAFYQMGSLILALWPRVDLAGDMGLIPAGELSSDFAPPIALAYNTRSSSEVAEVLKLAEASGGRIIKKANHAFWGGVQGYFADTEGNLWEVAFNSDFPIGEDGSIRLPQ